MFQTLGRPGKRPPGSFESHWDDRERFEQLRRNLKGAIPAGRDALRAPCPAHGGKDRNLSIRLVEGRLQIKCWSRGCDREAAPRAGKPLPAKNRPRPQPRPPEPPKASLEAAAVWRAGIADHEATRRYLAARGAWDPDEPLPDAVRWLPAGSFDCLPGSTQPPRSAYGCILYRFGSNAEAVQADALDAHCKPLEDRWRRTIGANKG